MKTVNLTGYVLDEEGNIYGKSGKLLSQFTKDGRYLFVNLCNDGKNGSRVCTPPNVDLP